MSARSPNPSTLRDVARQTHGHTIGPMPAQDFLDKFLPKTHIHNTRTRKNVYDRILNKKLYKAFSKSMGDQNLCPGFELVPLPTETKNNTLSGHKLLPGIAVYSRGAKRKSVCDWPLMDFFIEWRPDEHFDCYYEDYVNDEILDDSCDQAFEMRGRMFTYAAQLMDCQHRLFVFAIDMFDSYARLYRFDSSCIVVSDLIEYQRDSQLLDQFFARYSALSRVQRGYDPTVMPANNAEKVLFQARVKDYLERAKGENLRIHPDVQTLKGDVVKIKLYDMNGYSDWYLACKCNTIPINTLPCGRFTRGFVATPSLSASHARPTTSRKSDVKKGELFWLKDSWRPSSDASEASIYYDLKAKGVPNLPDIILTGDVQVGPIVQETMNDTLLSDPSTKSWRRSTDTIHHMIHHRIVSGLLIPLEYVENAKELLLVGRDTLNALAGAFYKGTMLHRDLSKGNLMMTERRGTDEGPWGVLNDWDRATRADIDFPYRTGTWQFMSIALLRDATKLHDIFDDLESLLWVLLFFAVRNFKYTGKFNMRVFNEATEVSDTENGRIVLGGDWKLTWLLQEVYKMGFVCKPLQDFFDSYSRLHLDHYWKITFSKRNAEERKALEDFEAEILRDISQLVSHFDNVLNDPNTDWSGQEAHHYRSTEAPPQVQQNQADRPDEEMGDPDGEQEPQPAAQFANDERGQKRKRSNLEPEDNVDDLHRQPKRLGIEAKEQRTVVRVPRRRQVTAPPCDRVLSPRTRK
ncbi:hypothetical protein QCA50_008768 [Cerrena zonata]|uniref:Fungal-type protein kinase domain-containing protein n=1 Tax=Cerrena zonata TaxID=2478898 RepID=A0AAW0G4G3_9APHY